MALTPDRNLGRRGVDLAVRFTTALVLVAAPTAAVAGCRQDQPSLAPDTCVRVTDQPILGPDGQPGPNRAPADPYTICNFKK